MDHLPERALVELLMQARTRVTVGAKYRHYKGLYYEVTGLVIIEATNEVGVVYRAQYGEELTFMRPLLSWMQTVEFEGVLMARFDKVGDQPRAK